MRFRWAGPDDHSALGEVMFNAVRTGPSPYTQAQRSAWMPAPRAGPDWDARLAAQDIVIAEEDGTILGFMSLASAGYIDFAYIRPEARGSGLFRALYDHILKRADERGERRLWVHASLMAEPAFGALGFAVTQRQTIVIGEERLDRSEMELRI